MRVRRGGRRRVALGGKGGIAGSSSMVQCSDQMILRDSGCNLLLVLSLCTHGEFGWGIASMWGAVELEDGVAVCGG